MTNLNKLVVSLTKHGAHKIAIILEQYPSNELLLNLDGSIPGVNIELAQAKKNLSAQNGHVPDLWQHVKELGSEYIKAITLISIIFSHHKLIKAMQQSSTQLFKGDIIRGEHLDGKSYTNFACIIDELGFSTYHSPNQVSYDLTPIFELDGLGALANDLLKLKLITAKWDGLNSLVDELVSIEAHNVFSMNEESFREWIDMDNNSSAADTTLMIEDDFVFFADQTDTTDGNFSFTSGHVDRDEGNVDISIARNNIQAKQLHNKIQNKLYLHLCNIYGDDSVGSEQPTGFGTKIDLAVNSDSNYIYFEIKTAKTTRACIRQALSQLMEYSYWPNNENASQLIIVSQNNPTPNSLAYLEHLREKFNIPIYYQKFDLESGELQELV